MLIADRLRLKALCGFAEQQVAHAAYLGEHANQLGAFLGSAVTVRRNLHDAVNECSRHNHMLRVYLTNLHNPVRLDNGGFGCHRHCGLVSPISALEDQIAQLVSLMGCDEGIIGLYRLLEEVLLAPDNPFLFSLLKRGADPDGVIDATQAEGASLEPCCQCTMADDLHLQ